jgi:hypothetical protein
MAAPTNVLEVLDQDALLLSIHDLYPFWGSPKFVTAHDTLKVISTANRYILIVEFSAHEGRLSVHIPTYIDDDDPRECWMPLIIGPLKFLNHSLPHLPIPKVHSYSLDSAPPVNVPYMIFDWIEGMPLQAFTKESPPRDARYRILNDLSDFVLDMALCPIAGDKVIWFYGRFPTHHS